MMHGKNHIKYVTLLLLLLLLTHTSQSGH